MDKTTHEIRLANWKQLIEQCASRPKGQTIQQWLKEHGIAEKQYYYWQRKVRARACEELESQGLMAPAMPKESETFFAEIPYRREENIMPLKAPAAVIHKAGATIAVSGDIPERLLSQIIKEVLHA